MPLQPTTAQRARSVPKDERELTPRQRRPKRQQAWRGEQSRDPANTRPFGHPAPGDVAKAGDARHSPWRTLARRDTQGHTCPAVMPLDPVLIAYAVSRSRKAGAVRWTRIGMAFPHETGAGLTVFLDAVPKDGVVILLERDDDDDERLAAMEAPRR